jgi:DmsE family decaheme c-type cytochrome
MNIIQRTLSGILLLAGLAWQPAATAQNEAKPSVSAASAPAPAASAPVEGPGTQYTEKGADTCLGCHDEEADSATFSTAGIFKGRHAHRGDARAPFGAGGLQCEACHGPGARHSVKGGSSAAKKRTINSLKADSYLPAEQRNAPCLGCHQGSSRTGWHAGAHDRGGLACTDCHKLHVERDAVLAKSSEPEVCYRCHKQQRGDFHKSSSHPVRFGRMACSDCHSPHGSSSAAMLVKPTVNQTCFTCHADKRGPLLWEHAPVAEDCTLCHSSHGSVRTALLNKTPPLLCQQCHSVAGHPSVARTAGGGASIFLLAGSCTNCHSQVHGSNHPAGAKLMR